MPTTRMCARPATRAVWEILYLLSHFRFTIESYSAINTLIHHKYRFLLQHPFVEPEPA